LAAPYLATTGCSDRIGRLGAALRTREQRPVTSDPTEGPWPSCPPEAAHSPHFRDFPPRPTLPPGHAKLRETVVSPEAWRLVATKCVGEPRGSPAEGNMLLCGLAPNCPDPGAHGAAPQLRAALVCDELLTLQRKQTSQLVLTAATHEAPLRAYVHDTARRAVEGGLHLDQVAEQRLVVTSFCMVAPHRRDGRRV